jgi:outer membrane autotransporter protein
MLGTHDERMGDLSLLGRSCRSAGEAAGATRLSNRIARADCGTDGWRPAVWGRLFGQQINNRYQAYADPRASGQIVGFQAGFDVLRSDSMMPGHKDYGGLFVGYGNAKVDVTGVVTNAAATAHLLRHTGHLDLKATSGGAYWTHYGRQGGYLDLVLQGTSYGGTTSTDFAHFETSGSGFISSLEGGYPIAVPQFGSGFVLEPQAQVLWQWAGFGARNDGLGPVALGTTSEGAARVGVKAKWGVMTDGGRVWQLYVRSNFWSNFGGSAATRFGIDSVPLISQAQYMDFDAGFTAKINADLSAFTNVGYQFAVGDSGGGRRDGVKGTAGLRYQW